MINIVLCGGSGERLWPISRNLMPKQFIKFFCNKSLFQLTVERNSRMCSSQYLVSNEEQYFLALDQLDEICKKDVQYILEPIGRNTAPAIALACLGLSYDEIVLVTPSDHLVKNEIEYEMVLLKAKEYALDNKLVTFGIVPSSPEVGFGYIEANQFDVKTFHEKPDFITASRYFEAGNYYWNSGIFCFKAGVFLDELKKHSFEIYQASRYAYERADKEGIVRIKLEDMLKIPNNSIDYAVMEKSSHVKVIPSDIDWSDVGSFDSLYMELPKDENGNSLNNNNITIDSKNNLLYSNTGRKIVTININDLIVVETGDALLISSKGSSQTLKEVVKKLKENHSELHNTHLIANRPWGNYIVLEDSSGFKIKKIIVKPGKRLSLQKHFHRSEHWIVVSGTATVTNSDKIFTVRANESIYIKMGDSHRLANDGKIDLIVIEVQVGLYTGEDDIVRLEDDFKRKDV